ncbi:FliO/MopB family protein [Algiphilus sp.]|uniref:FliO/MopB family protein n=1 Tax=Algiphilus sp. TaxID=1872431 RepID=UPI0025C3B277|nr:flagellar biosynthetic protein FliO [Algiphilus sp.]MCK5771344.1 flagellar biosynthetic protein FliO [Algiphilus sp.]
MEAASLTDGTAAAALRAFVALLVVVALILATAWGVRRLRGGFVPAAGWFRVRAAHALGPRDRVMLVDAAGAHLLLSVGQNGVRVLHRYDDAPELPEAQAAMPFAERLARMRRGGE